MKVMLVFDAVILLFGIYMVISSLQMKKSGRINAMVIAEEEMKNVRIRRDLLHLFTGERRCLEESWYWWD